MTYWALIFVAIIIVWAGLYVEAEYCYKKIIKAIEEMEDIIINEKDGNVL